VESDQASMNLYLYSFTQSMVYQVDGENIYEFTLLGTPENNFNDLDEGRKPTVSAIESSRRALAPVDTHKL